MLICLCINYDRDHMAQKASNIYSLALYKKKKICGEPETEGLPGQAVRVLRTTVKQFLLPYISGLSSQKWTIYVWV